SGPSTASDWALTAKLTSPTPGNVAEKPAGVKSCKVPSSRIFGEVRPCGVGIPLSGLVSASDRNVAINPTVAPLDTKLSSSRTSLTPPPPPSIVMVPWLVIALFSLLRADSRQHVRRILWPGWRKSATMGVLKSVEPTGFLAFAPAFAGTNRADVDRRIIPNCPHGRGRVLSSPACLVPALPA